ncbi:MAG TPA: hypothetical protein VNZ45_17860 [Bacteroidia bacterium]|nr:hypothetical protein [Bacteroidia bacterium]
MYRRIEIQLNKRFSLIPQGPAAGDAQPISALLARVLAFSHHSNTTMH